MRFKLIFALFFVLFLPALTLAEQETALENLSPFLSDSQEVDLETLLAEAMMLFATSRPIDARAKLQKAVVLAPNDFRPHLLLGRYYLFEEALFNLAYRYLLTAKKLFYARYGKDPDEIVEGNAWREHFNLLMLLSEAELNLDRYQDSLNTLDQFEELYWDIWYPGKRAWVLMKLRRLEEAISVTQLGLLKGAEPTITYNILGILLSLKGDRKLSLDAFARAIQAELKTGSGAQIATPLNNAGEVYSEMFADELAEASWLKALAMPDGCNHVLPSLNLAELYIDQLRLLQAERVLSDFEACFSAHSIRTDSEHRSLLALFRGRIALRRGEIDAAVSYMEQALANRQWYGSIGTTPEDMALAGHISLAQAYQAKANALADVAHKNMAESAKAWTLSSWLRLRTWWLNRRAREIAIDDLYSFEDLFVRNTDTMIQYPTLGATLAGFPYRSLEGRIARVLKDDKRANARPHYYLYLGINALSHGNEARAIELLQKAKNSFRKIDRLAYAEALAHLVTARKQSWGFFNWPSADEQSEQQKLIEELFALLPSQLRYFDLALPVRLAVASDSSEAKAIASELKDMFLANRFEVPEKDLLGRAQYTLNISANKASKGEIKLETTLAQTQNGQVLSREQETVPLDGSGLEVLVNRFIENTFIHKVDPPAEPTPELELLEGLL